MVRARRALDVVNWLEHERHANNQMASPMHVEEFADKMLRTVAVHEPKQAMAVYSSVMAAFANPHASAYTQGSAGAIANRLARFLVREHLNPAMPADIRDQTIELVFSVLWPHLNTHQRHRTMESFATSVVGMPVHHQAAAVILRANTEIWTDYADPPAGQDDLRAHLAAATLRHLPGSCVQGLEQRLLDKATPLMGCMWAASNPHQDMFDAVWAHVQDSGVLVAEQIWGAIMILFSAEHPSQWETAERELSAARVFSVCPEHIKNRIVTDHPYFTAIPVIGSWALGHALDGSSVRPSVVLKM